MRPAPMLIRVVDPGVPRRVRRRGDDATGIALSKSATG
jgi:hypothetical protein